MKTLLKFTIPAVIVGLAIASVVSAQVFSPQYFVKNGTNLYPLNPASTTIGTSTAVGQFGTLTDASGNKYSTSTSGVSSSTTNTFAGANFFNGDTYVGSSSAIYASPLGYTLTNATSAWQYYQNLCNNNSANGPVTIMTPAQTISSSSWGNGTLVISNRCKYENRGGGATVWNGASVANVPIVQYAVPNVPQTQGGGVVGVTLNCTDPTVSTSSPSIGLLEGSSTSAGGFGTQTEWDTITNCGNAIQVASGTYNMDIGFNSIHGDAQAINFAGGVNQGEGDDVHDNWIADPTGNQSTAYVYLASSAVGDLKFTNNVLDNGQFYMSGGNTVIVSGNKTENAGNYPSYIPWYEAPSQASLLVMTGEKVYTSGAASKMYTALFDLNSQAIINGVEFNVGSGTSTAANILQDSAASADENVSICSFNGWDASTSNYGGYAEFAPKALSVPTSTAWNGCVSQLGNGDASWQGSLSNGNYQIQADNLSVLGGIVQSGGVVSLASTTVSGNATATTINATASYSANGVTGSSLGTCGTGLGISSTTISEGLVTAATCTPYSQYWLPITSYDSNGGTAIAPQTVNQVRLFGPITNPNTIQGNAMQYYINTSDASATDLYDIGLYYLPSLTSTVATLVADVGASSSTAAAGIRNVSTTQGTVTLPAGAMYLIGITGNSTTAKFGAGFSSFTLWYSAAGSASAGGVLPSTTSVPVQNDPTTNSNYPTFTVHL